MISRLIDWLIGEKITVKSKISDLFSQNAKYLLVLAPQM